jgi:hypothetical protein
VIDPKNLPKLPGQCCGNCKWFLYRDNVTRHATPRFPQEAGGNCAWPQPTLPLPSAITLSYGYRLHSRCYIRVTHTGCPTWEAGENVIESVPKEIA